MYDDCVVTSSDVFNAIVRLKSHKNDDSSELSTDHFINAGAELSVHVGLLFSAIISHGAVPTDFVTSTVLPVPFFQYHSSCSQN